MAIVNLTQHTPTPEQTAAGVVQDPRMNEGDLGTLTQVLTFASIEEATEQDALVRRAEALATRAAKAGYTAAMIGGAPFFMASLERALRMHGVKPLYAFSQRESVDETQADGSVRKVAVFRHVGFVEAT